MPNHFLGDIFYFGKYTFVRMLYLLIPIMIIQAKLNSDFTIG